MLKDIRQIRKRGVYEECLEFSQLCKEIAGKHFYFEDYDGAVLEYERSLAIWEWIETCVEDWRRTVSVWPLLKGIFL